MNVTCRKGYVKRRKIQTETLTYSSDKSSGGGVDYNERRAA
jgi:hypothetical protein